MNNPQIPTVVNFKTVKAHWNSASRKWDSESYLYIGRKVAYYNLAQSVWANPFRLTDEAKRGSTLEKYRTHILYKLAFYYLDISTLTGKILVCWCKGTHGTIDVPCHGDILIEMFNEYYPET